MSHLHLRPDWANCSYPILETRNTPPSPTLDRLDELNACLSMLNCSVENAAYH